MGTCAEIGLQPCIRNIRHTCTRRRRRRRRCGASDEITVGGAVVGDAVVVESILNDQRFSE